MDDSRIPFIVGTLGAAFAFLFSSWSNKQDNDEFFNGAFCLRWVCMYV